MLDAQRCLQSRHRRDAMARNIRPRISAPHALYTSQMNVIGIPRIMSHYSRFREEESNARGAVPQVSPHFTILVRARYLPAPRYPHTAKKLKFGRMMKR
jgi:hypothetical protein